MTHTDAERARLRAQAASAGSILFSTWPVRTFVAVNPLGGLEHRPFEQAVGLAGRSAAWRGICRWRPSAPSTRPGASPTPTWRAPCCGACPSWPTCRPGTLGHRSITALEALRADLLLGRRGARATTGAARRR